MSLEAAEKSSKNWKSYVTNVCFSVGVRIAGAGSAESTISSTSRLAMHLLSTYSASSVTTRMKSYLNWVYNHYRLACRSVKMHTYEILPGISLINSRSGVRSLCTHFSASKPFFSSLSIASAVALCILGRNSNGVSITYTQIQWYTCMHLIQHGVATWLLVSEPDPQKIWIGGLGDRLGWMCTVCPEYRKY